MAPAGVYVLARIYEPGGSVVKSGPMKTRSYSPRLDRDLISVLYRLRRARGIPMTALASQLIRAALRYEGVLGERGGEERDSRVAER